ncbi:hypothetical protein JCM3766R1_001418 [Sporobolomyces carnicolor]
MTDAWSYSTECSLSESDTPSLVLNAHSSVPASLGTNCLFATSQFALDLSVCADGESLDPTRLQGSAIVRETVDWLTTNAPKLGVDAVGSPSDCRGVPLHVATRSSHAQALVLDLPLVPAVSLETLSLELEFTSHAAPTRGAGSQDGILTNQLLAACPVPLHFALTLVLHTSLARLFEYLSESFPSCFNPIWVQRLTNDLAPFRTIASSLSRILDPSTLISTGQLSLEELSEAKDLQRDLVHLFSSTSTDPNDLEAPRALGGPGSNTTSWTDACEKSLLLLAKQSDFVDPVNVGSTVALAGSTSSDKVATSKGTRGSRRAPGPRARGSSRRKRGSARPTPESRRGPRKSKPASKVDDYSTGETHDAQDSVRGGEGSLEGLCEIWTDEGGNETVGHNSEEEMLDADVCEARESVFDRGGAEGHAPSCEEPGDIEIILDF